MWVRAHHREPEETRPRWVPRSHGIVRAHPNYAEGFQASATVVGKLARVDPGIYATLADAKRSADLLVKEYDPHVCGERCTPWENATR
jgi:hypothetical protein